MIQPAAAPEAIPGDRPESLGSAAALLAVSQAKGLEFAALSWRIRRAS